FVCDIFKRKESPIDEKFIHKIPLRMPKVPQQTNGEECGIFVLYFIHLFMNNIPQSYSYSNTKNWFDSDDLDRFRKNVHAFFQRKT
ncbi:Sentrin-specific protease, partial [Zostera marina]